MKFRKKLVSDWKLSLVLYWLIKNIMADITITKENKYSLILIFLCFNRGSGSLHSGQDSFRGRFFDSSKPQTLQFTRDILYPFVFL